MGLRTAIGPDHLSSAHPLGSVAKRARRGFSLVELLIVAAVIGLLLAVLLPSLGGAHEASKTAVCGSNLRQIQLAADAYANDHKDRYCPGSADALGNLNRWHGARATASAGFAPAGGALTPYISDGASPALRTCPAFAAEQKSLAAAAGASAGFERSAGGYGYNNAFVGTDRAAAPIGGGGGQQGGRRLWTISTDLMGAARSRFADPQGTVAFADSATAAGGWSVVEYSFIEPRFWPDAEPVARPDPTIHFRHQRARSGAAGTANSCWLDGHVSVQARSATATDGIYGVSPAALGLGWFGKDDDNSLFDYE